MVLANLNETDGQFSKVLSSVSDLGPTNIFFIPSPILHMYVFTVSEYLPVEDYFIYISLVALFSVNATKDFKGKKCKKKIYSLKTVSSAIFYSLIKSRCCDSILITNTSPMDY